MGPDFLRSPNLDLSVSATAAAQALANTGQLGRFSATSCGSVSHLVWSTGVDTRKTTALVSSRLGRELDRKDAFFRILRTACSQLDPTTQSVLSAEGTAAHPYVCRAAELFGLDLISVTTASKRQSLEAWLVETAELADRAAKSHRVYISPSIQSKESPHPVRDAFIVRNANQVVAIHLRNKGAIESLLHQRLDTPNPGRVFLAMGCDGLVPQHVAASLMERGAIGWVVTSFEDQDTVPFAASTRTFDLPPILELDDVTDQDRYLTHCTRNANGPWPDQNETDYLDELILGDAMRDRSAFASLIRILSQRRILATGAAIRNNTAVVSLTGVPLAEISTLRRYRSHRGRWDFEPYGLAICRKHLIQQGAREVIYGNESMWSALSETEQPFFQKLGDKANSIDWRVEQEHRLLNDIELETIAPNQALVFVPSREEAEMVARLSKWPVVVV